MNPHPREGVRISSAARQTVSGYLPFRFSGATGNRTRITSLPNWCLPVGPWPRQWTSGESNPDYLGANQASSHWTSSPCCFTERSVRELNPAFLLTMQVCCRNTYSSGSNPQVASPGIEPGDQPYESQLSTNWPASSVSREEESRTPTPRGHDVLSVACLPIPPLRDEWAGTELNRHSPKTTGSGTDRRLVAAMLTNARRPLCLLFV